jgi:hypothetical protein
MKNIHVLPTEKPSRLIKSKINDTIVLEPINVTNNTRYWEYLNIYITSDEEIKEGDWCYYENGDLKGIHKVVNGQRPKTMILKKIILTTDQDLIADGIQAIDDEFLEWFVKNPSCEMVDLYRVLNTDFSYKFRIIIPKEEPKQENTAEYIDRHIVEAMVEVAKQKLYSEEEVYHILCEHTAFLFAGGKSTLSEWFEQFKKK